jgi:hypothetical protein
MAASLARGETKFVGQFWCIALVRGAEL